MKLNHNELVAYGVLRPTIHKYKLIDKMGAAASVEGGQDGQDGKEQNTFSLASLPDAEARMNDLLLTVKSTCLCGMTYKNSSIDVANKPFEDEWIEKLEIKDFKIWDYTDPDSKPDENGKLEIDTQVLTGILNTVSPEFPDSLPFVCFRGTKGIHDMVADLASILSSELKTRKGNLVGNTGMGFIAKMEPLRDLGLMDHVVGTIESCKTGVLIIGHSLGGALATVFAAELHKDYPEIFENYPVRLCTVGAPRVFDIDTAKAYHNLSGNYRHIRLVNEDDFITTLPPRKMQLLYHSGIVFFYKKGGGQLEVKVGDEVFDFGPDNDDSVAGAGIAFAASGASPHLISSQGGYLQRLNNCSLYKHVLDNVLDEKFKTVFKNLPIKIDEPTSVVDGLLNSLLSDNDNGNDNDNDNDGDNNDD